MSLKTTSSDRCEELACDACTQDYARWLTAIMPHRGKGKWFVPPDCTCGMCQKRRLEF